jgi:ankyrin repeat protein
MKDNKTSEDQELNHLLTLAAKEGDVATVEKLIKKGADVNDVDRYGKTSLMYAAEDGHTETVAYLLDKGAEVDHADSNGDTALIYAAENGHKESVAYLLEKGVAIDQADHIGATALIVASQAGHSEMVAFLIDKGAVVNQAANLGFTALMQASLRGHSEVIECLLEKGAAVDQVDHTGGTALMCASRKGHKETVAYLLDQGATVDHADSSRLTALMLAANAGQIETTKLLLQASNPELIEYLERTLRNSAQSAIKGVGVKVKLDFTGDSVHALAKYMIAKAVKCFFNVPKFINSFNQKYIDLLADHIKQLSEKMGHGKAKSFLSITIDFSQRPECIRSNSDAILQETALVLEKQQMEKEGINKKTVWRKSGLSSIKLDSDGSILLDEDIRLDSGCFVDAGYFLDYLEKRAISIKSSEDIIKESVCIQSFAALMRKQPQELKEKFNLLIQTIEQQTLEMKGMIDSLNRWLGKYPGLLFVNVCLTQLSEKAGELNHKAVTMKKDLEEALNSMAFKINKSGKLLVEELGREWIEGSECLKEKKGRVEEIVGQYTRTQEKALDFVRDHLLKRSGRELEECNEQKDKWALGEGSPKPDDVWLQMTNQFVECMEVKCEQIPKEIVLDPLNPKDSITALESSFSKLSQLIGAKKDLAKHVSLTGSEEESMRKIMKFRDAVSHYREIDEEFALATAHFKSVKKKFPDELAKYWEEFLRIKRMQQNLNPTKWISKIRLLCKSSIALASRAVKAEVLREAVVSTAGGPKPAVRHVVGELVIHDAQRVCLEGIKDAARKISDSKCAGAEEVAVKRGLIRHYVAALKGDGFLSREHGELHDLLGHQLQFYTVEDSSLIDKMFTVINDPQISYTDCMDKLASLVNGIVRLEAKEESKFLWDSLSKSGKRPKELLKQALEFLHRCSNAHTDLGAESLIVAYSKVDALFTLTKLWSAADKKRLLLEKLGARDCLDVESEIKGYVQMRNKLRHDSGLVFKGIGEICEELFGSKYLESVAMEGGKIQP